MSETTTTTTAATERPAPNGYKSWNEHWTAQGMPWRIMPEIDEERQRVLLERLTLTVSLPLPPLHGLPLRRDDVEWMLARHESGGRRGPVDWNDEKQRDRTGINLRGADLRGVDLSGLPLARLRGGFRDFFHWGTATPFQRQTAVVHLEGANLSGARLQGAALAGAHLEVADLSNADLSEAYLKEAHLEGADLSGAQMSKAILEDAHMEGADLMMANLRSAFLGGAHLEGVALSHAHLEGASLSEAYLGGKLMSADTLERIRQWGPAFAAILPPTKLCGAFLDEAVNVEGISLGSSQYGFPQLADVRWGGANLATIDWEQVTELGDEYWAREWTPNGHVDMRIWTESEELEKPESKEDEDKVRLGLLEAAVRSSRQLAVTLRNQGLNERADHFTNRANVLQRQVLRRRHQYLRYGSSLVLDLISGYGYKPMRSFITYLLVVGAFATTYYLLGNNVSPPLDPLGAVVFSITSFHGRGFTPGESVLPNNPLTVIAAGEAIIGLVIEITFIATFTQRFFAR